MRALLASVLVVAACTSGSSKQPSACGGATCDSSEVCDMTDPAGPTCIDADGDVDGDGIPNGEDFCEHMAGGAHDEDGDGIGDECDACPIAPPPPTPDLDGDKVDRPCDPDPDSPGDEIVAFAGFEDGIPSNWTATSGWTTEDGFAVVHAGATPEKLNFGLPYFTTHTAILTAYTVDDTDGNAQVAVYGSDIRPAGTTIITCAAARNGSADQLELTTDVSSMAHAFANLFDPSAKYQLAVTMDNITSACIATSSAESQITSASTGGDSMTAAGLTAQNATLRFAYILAIQRNMSTSGVAPE
ncbi:MAG TPA: hypothetical protein VGM88_05020 [Kofleriaceae bacterium]|jgi:hypothetical protein